MQRLHGGLILLALLSTVASSVAGAGQRPAPLSRETCVVTVLGNEHPDRVPPAVVWERAFDRLGRGDDAFQKLGFDNTARGVVRNRLVVVNNDLTRLRSYQSGPSRVQEIAAAQAILDARDDLIRALPPDRFAQLEALASDVYDVMYQPPASGSIKNGHCVMSVRGRDFPDLISEAAFWRLYIEGRAAASRPYRAPNGRLTAEHLRAVQSELQLSPEDVQRVVDRCTAVAGYIASLPPIASSTERQINRAVLGLRAEFIRTFSPADWNAIKADANRARAGMVLMHSR